MSQNVLIAGGFGFIGARIARHIQETGHQVVIGSRRALSKPTWLPGANCVRVKWDDAQALERMCAGVDVVIHAAGMNSQGCANDPVAAMELNGLATARLVAAASRTGVTRFIYLSTAHVYASPLVGRISEDTCPQNLHPYAISHLTGEKAVLSYGKYSKISAVVVRLSNAFGAPVHGDVNCWMLLVNDLCRQAVREGKLVLNSSGLQQRDFITLSDVVRAVCHIKDMPEACIGDGLFNLGGETSMSVFDMAQRVARNCKEILGFMPAILRPEPMIGESIAPLNYDTTKLMGTGFRLNKDIDAEIAATLQFCVDEYVH